MYYTNQDTKEMAVALENRFNYLNSLNNKKERLTSKDISKDTSENNETITIVGHSNDIRTTVGNYTPEEMAELIASKYQNNKQNLKEIILISCESGVKPKKNWLDMFPEAAFSQQLVNVLVNKYNFNENIKVLSIEPPINVYATRVSVTISKSLMATGHINAYATKNESAAQKYDKNPNANYENDKDVISLIKQETSKNHIEMFRDKATSFKHSNTMNITNDKLLTTKRRGMIYKILETLLGIKQLNMISKKYSEVNVKEQKALNEISELKNKIELAVKNKVESTHNLLGMGGKKHWTSLENYLNSGSSPVEKFYAWQNLEKSKNHFCDDKQKDKKLGTTGFNYQSIYETLEKKQNIICESEKTKQSIRNELITIIDKYISKNTNKTPKITVMNAIKKYLQTPTESNFKNISDITNQQISKGWDKGTFFSKVKQIHDEVVELHKSTQNSPNRKM